MQLCSWNPVCIIQHRYRPRQVVFSFISTHSFTSHPFFGGKWSWQGFISSPFCVVRVNRCLEFREVIIQQCSAQKYGSSQQAHSQNHFILSQSSRIFSQGRVYYMSEIWLVANMDIACKSKDFIDGVITLVYPEILPILQEFH